MGDRSDSQSLAGNVEVLPAPPSYRRNVLDRAHQGDIEGALGRLRVDQRPPRSRRLSAFLVVLGPGLVVMVANNDAGTISTTAQAGQDYGLRWLWLPVALAGVLFIVQEMAARLGAVTGSGHARLIFERFGPRWGWFALSDLLLLNVLTLVTEFVGLQFGLGYFGVSRLVAVPLGAVALLGMSMMGSFRTWERVALGLVVASLALVPLLVALQLVLPHSVAAAIRPHPTGRNSGVLLALAMVGTVVAPWQLFFQQSHVVDKRITARWLGYERADTLTGTAIFALVSAASVAVCAYAFAGTALHGRFVNAAAVAAALRHHVGSLAGTVFAVVLIDGSLLGAGVVSLAAGYAVGEVSGWRHSLHRRWKDARRFYAIQAVFIAAAALIVLVTDHRLGLMTTAIQAVSTVLFPSAGVFLILLCNDRAVLGPWVNRWGHNALAVILVDSMLVLSALSLLKAAFPRLDMDTTVMVIAALTVPVMALLVLGSGGRLGRRDERRDTWSMPPFERLEPPRPSWARTAGLVILRVYLVVALVALVLMVVKVAA
jgi:Mn2+/Fe2+ NRAMP family transporter